MSLLAAIRKLWPSIASRTHSDVEEEFRSTLDAYQEDLIRQGLPEEEARRKARIDLGRPSAQNVSTLNVLAHARAGGDRGGYKAATDRMVGSETKECPWHATSETH